VNQNQVVGISTHRDAFVQDAYRHALSAKPNIKQVGLFRITGATFHKEHRPSIRHHRVGPDGPSNRPCVCRFSTCSGSCVPVNKPGDLFIFHWQGRQGGGDFPIMGTTPATASDSATGRTAGLPDRSQASHHSSLGQRCRSLYHGLWFRLSERLRWSRKPYHEVPATHLAGLKSWQAACVHSLRTRYDVRFESSYGHQTALASYAYLDLLDQAWNATARPIPEGGRVTDVGCANFWYARALHTFFRPSTLTGVDVEGFRLYPTGYSRYDAAAGYIADLPHTAFVVADYSEVKEQADVITAWFPFVTPAPVLAWRLPLTLFSPERFFLRIACNLARNGTFFMVNQGLEETDVAADYCRRAGLRSQGHWVHPQPLRPRPHPPVASWWTT
jgi:hypothetical protein